MTNTTNDRDFEATVDRMQDCVTVGVRASQPDGGCLYCGGFLLWAWRPAPGKVTLFCADCDPPIGFVDTFDIRENAALQHPSPYAA